MSGIEVAVVAAAVAAVAWVNWYFFLSQPASRPADEEERR